MAALPPAGIERVGKSEQWLQQHSLPMSSIDRTMTAEIDRRLGLKINGQPLAASTASRWRIVARACSVAADEAGLTALDP